MKKYTTKIEKDINGNYDYLVHICDLQGDKIMSYNGCRSLTYQVLYPADFVENYSEARLVVDALKIGVPRSELIKMGVL